MRILQFAKWWWDRNDALSRIVVCYILFWGTPCLIAAFWFGKIAAFTALAGFFSIFIGIFLYHVLKWTKELWIEFEDSNPTEEVLIVRKLKGIPTPPKGQ